jgi:hypothetical protein
MQIRARMSMSADGWMTFESERALPGGSVEIVYAVGSGGGAPGVRQLADSARDEHARAEPV